MRAPRFRVKSCRGVRKFKEKPRNTGCSICKDKLCLDERMSRYTYTCDRLTRSVSKLLKELNEIIIYETYRCMPLLGDEKVHAPDWEEHIVRYHIVFVKKMSQK